MLIWPEQARPEQHGSRFRGRQNVWSDSPLELLVQPTRWRWCWKTLAAKPIAQPIDLAA